MALVDMHMVDEESSTAGMRLDVKYRSNQLINYGIGMVWYGMVWYGMVWYGMSWHGNV